MNTSSILITGAAGALGRVVFRCLQRDGLRVRGFDRYPCPWAGEVDWVLGNLQSPQDCQRALVGVGTLIHLAAVPDDAPFETDLVPSNILGLHHLLEAAKKVAVQKILIASTGQVVWEPLNHGPWPIQANAAPSPRSWYALTKVFAEQAGLVLARDHGIDVMNIRLGACPRSAQHAEAIGQDDIARDAYSGEHGSRFSVVRYRNVMGSCGSVTPFFPSIRDKRVLPLTNEHMTRFIISLEQCVEIVWHAFENLIGREIYS